MKPSTMTEIEPFGGLATHRRSNKGPLSGRALIRREVTGAGQPFKTAVETIEESCPSELA